MKAAQLIGLLLLEAGIVFLVLGINATQSMKEELRSEFLGEYSSETVWYIAGGVVCILVGGVLALLGLRRSHRPSRDP